MTPIAYIAGPMTGLPGFNYRAFDEARDVLAGEGWKVIDRKSTRLNSSHRCISYAVFCLKKKNNNNNNVDDETLPVLDTVLV